MTTAAERLVELLAGHGIDRAFCVPGESYLGVLDAFHGLGGFDLVCTRHEGGGAFMAVADAKLTGRPGVMFASRGPGATNASIGVHVAGQDAVPMLLFIGQVARADLGRGAFQEMDYHDFFGGTAKWVAEVTDGADLGETVRQAIHRACSGTPGPVVISLPEDMLADPVSGPAPEPLPVEVPQAGADDVQRICERLAVAERPLIIAGGQVGGPEGRALLRRVAEAFSVPVAASWRHQDVFDNRHPNFALHLGFNMPALLADAVNEADLVIAMGTRLGDVTTQGYRVPEAPRPRQPLVHVYGDKSRIGHVFETDLAIAAEATQVLGMMAEINPAPPPPARAAWIETMHALSAERMAWEPVAAEDGVVFGNVVAHLGRVAEEDAVITLDAGNFATWVHRLFPFRATNLMLGALAGSMGFGVPAVVAAALRDPGRQAICFVGDGGFQMTGLEISVAAERRLPVRVFVSRNNSLATIRQYQERSYPHRVIATDLPSPDFTRIAEAYGITGLKIATDAHIEPVIAEALATDGPVIVEVATSLEYISAFARLSELAGG